MRHHTRRHVIKVYFNATWATKMFNTATPGQLRSLSLHPPDTLSSKTSPPCKLLLFTPEDKLTSWTALTGRRADSRLPDTSVYLVGTGRPRRRSCTGLVVAGSAWCGQEYRRRLQVAQLRLFWTDRKRRISSSVTQKQIAIDQSPGYKRLHKWIDISRYRIV